MTTVPTLPPGDISVPAPPAKVLPVTARPTWLSRRTLLIALAAIALVVGTYAYAWFEATQLSEGFVHDADTFYAQGDYLKALVGSEEFDPSANKYVTKGGYLQVQKIWADPYARPRPPDVDRANQRIQEIIYQRMTIPQAEQFVQANTGKSNPYFGIIYLRLGELYQQSGDIADAKDVYNNILDSFRNDPDLVAQAQQHLAQLPSK